jgi:hypothetical protein
VNVIQIVNQTSRAQGDLGAAWLARLADGLTNQLQRDFCPDYGLAGWCVTTSPTPGAHQLVLLDHSDAGALLGYHDKTPEGLPYAKVFCEGQDPQAVEVTASHEALELAGDPDAQRFQFPGSGPGKAEEACDAVEELSYPDPPTGVMLSDYVLPAWYVQGSPGPWDKLSRLSGPLTQTAGGYTIEDAGGSIGTNPPEAAARKGKDHAASRTARRLARGRRRATTAPELEAK